MEGNAKFLHLGSIRRTSGTEHQAEFDIGEAIDPALFQQHQNSARFLSSLLSESPMAGLSKAHGNFVDTVNELISPSTQNDKTQELSKGLIDTFDSILSAMRAFSDRTTHYLKHRYGSHSIPVSLFKEALSYEFDNEFPYRFMYKLRNYSQHCGKPQINVKVSAYFDKDRQKVREVSAGLNTADLLASFDSWGVLVRDELRALNGELDAIGIADRMFFCCNRAYAKLLAELEPEILDAAKAIDACNKSAESDDTATVFFNIDPTQWEGNGKRDIETTVIRVDLAALARKALSDLPSLISHAPAQPATVD